MKLNFRILKPILIAIILFIILTLRDLLIEMVGGKIGDFLRDNFRITTTTLVYILIGILVISLGYAIYEVFKNPSEKQESKTTTEDFESYTKEYYDSLQKRYLKRYKDKLDGRFEITLEVSENWNGENTQKFTGEYEGKGRISEAFEYINLAFEKQGRLLIVGNPGVGKTVLLLKLALELLEKAGVKKEDESYELVKGKAFPVIFNLASWSDEYKNFDDWLISVLNSGEGLRKDIAEKLLQEERIVLLLDGLDELARSEDEETAAKIRAKCLQSLNDYLDRGKKAVICCRVNEFELLQTLTGEDAPVSAKVKINDLSEAEVLNTLLKVEEDDTNKRAATNLLDILKKDENQIFLKVLSTPFYFTTALEVFDKQIFEENSLPENVDNLKSYLRREFIVKKLNKTANPNEFDKEKTRKWLIWLAEFINRKKTIIFELADLQPSDLTGRWKFELFSRLMGSFLFIVFSVGFFLTIFGLFNGLVISVVLGFFVNYFFISDKIATEDIVNFDFTKFLKLAFWGEFLFAVLIGSVLIGLLVGFTGGLMIGLLMGILKGFRLLKDIQKYSNLENPYQRIKGGILVNIYFSILLVMLFIAGTILSVFYLQKNNFDNKVVSLPILFLFFGIVKLQKTTISLHCILRFCLYLEDKMPLNYATFLDYAAEARILEKDGGHWRFRHQNLQDYFADLDEQSESPASIKNSDNRLKY